MKHSRFTTKDREEFKAIIHYVVSVLKPMLLSNYTRTHTMLVLAIAYPRYVILGDFGPFSIYDWVSDEVAKAERCVNEFLLSQWDGTLSSQSTMLSLLCDHVAGIETQNLGVFSKCLSLLVDTFKSTNPDPDRFIKYLLNKYPELRSVRPLLSQQLASAKQALDIPIRSMNNMSCYDSFFLNATCPDCKSQFEFEIQTKDFDCLLNCWRPYDYIGVNRTFVYSDTCCFKTVCPNCGRYTDTPSAYVVNGFLSPGPIDTSDTYSVINFLQAAAVHNSSLYSQLSYKVLAVARLIGDLQASDDEPELTRGLREIRIKHNRLGVTSDSSNDEILARIRSYFSDEV